AGVLSAKGFDGAKLVSEAEIETTEAPTRIELSPDRTAIQADRRDVSVINISILDPKGRVVPVANNLIHFQLEGPGKIIGVGNGNCSSHERDICTSEWQRSAFNGLAQVIIQ